MTTFIPRGEMCMTCISLYKDCSKLPFDKMPAIKKHSDGVFEVKCLYRVPKSEDKDGTPVL